MDEVVDEVVGNLVDVEDDAVNPNPTKQHLHLKDNQATATQKTHPTNLLQKEEVAKQKVVAMVVQTINQIPERIQTMLNPIPTMLNLLQLPNLIPIQIQTTQSNHKINRINETKTKTKKDKPRIKKRIKDNHSSKTIRIHFQPTTAMPLRHHPRTMPI